MRSILPLFLVYVAEYLINQSVAPTLLFPLHSTPFSHFRSFYPTYAVRSKALFPPYASQKPWLALTRPWYPDNLPARRIHLPFLPPLRPNPPPLPSFLPPMFKSTRPRPPLPLFLSSLGICRLRNCALGRSPWRSCVRQHVR